MGAFEVFVLDGGTVDGVMQWLGDNGFQQDPAAEPILGEYLAEGGFPRPRPWQGWRGLDGLWDTSIGRLHLVEAGEQVRGGAEHDETARVEADVAGGGLMP